MKINFNLKVDGGIPGNAFLVGLAVFVIAVFYIGIRHNPWDIFGAATSYSFLDLVLMAYALLFGAIFLYHKHRKGKSEAEAAKAVAGDFARIGTTATMDSIIYIVAIIAILVLLFLVAILLTPDYHF